MLENNLTKDETLGNYERQYWNLHQSHGRPWDPLSEQVLIVKAFKTIIVALSSIQCNDVSLSLDWGKFLFCSSFS